MLTDDGCDPTELCHNCAHEMVETLKAQLAEKKKLLEQTSIALGLLYADTASYIQVNHLGDIHHNLSMQRARDALAALRKEGEKA